MQIIKKEKINLKEIAKAINQGKVLACPTDTVYGLVCDASDKKAVEKVFEIKIRPRSKPLPIFVKNLRMAKKIAKINEQQEKILKSVWPGKVTAVLKRKSGIKLYGVDKKTIALRIPNYKLVNELLHKLRIPLTGTSANISGKPGSTRIKEIVKQFKNQKYQPDIIIDAGNLTKGRPSIVLDLTVSPPKILRL